MSEPSFTFLKILECMSMEENSRWTPNVYAVG